MPPGYAMKQTIDDVPLFTLSKKKGFKEKNYWTGTEKKPWHVNGLMDTFDR